MTNKSKLVTRKRLI